MYIVSLKKYFGYALGFIVLPMLAMEYGRYLRRLHSPPPTMNWISQNINGLLIELPYEVVEDRDERFDARSIVTASAYGINTSNLSMLLSSIEFKGPVDISSVASNLVSAGLETDGQKGPPSELAVYTNKNNIAGVYSSGEIVDKGKKINAKVFVFQKDGKTISVTAIYVADKFSEKDFNRIIESIRLP